jgi:DHA1 family bicyclomycin/chloramphenicol resistance-like MFS transporter
VLLLTLVKLPETAPNLGLRTPLLGVFRAFPTLIVNRVFVLNVIAVSTSSAAFFAFIAAAPYIVVETMGRGSDTYGAYFILNAAGYMVGNYAMARLVMKIGAPRMVHLGLVISSVAMTVAVPLSLRADWSPIMLFLPLAVNAIGNGMTIPGSTAEALSARPDLAGSAAGLMGALQLGFSALMTVAISLVVTIWPPSLVVLMWLLTIIGMIAIHFGRSGAAAR